MKSSKKIILVLLALTVLTVLTACNFGGEANEIPKSAIDIPDALLSSAGSRTSVGVTYENLFEPFRVSLKTASDVLNYVNSLIDEINQNVVPDTYEGPSGDDYLRITTDTGRTYTKRLEFSESAEDDPFLQINYSPGTAAGELYYEDTAASAGDLETIKVYYDSSIPVLQAWLTVKAETSGSYPVNLYFNAVKNSAGNIEIEGGLTYHFLWDADPITYPFPDSSERVYVFRAYANGEGTKAQVGLYFPLSTVVTVTEAHDIQQSFLEILYTWLEANDFGFWDQNITSQEEFNTFVLAQDAAALGDLGFILSLVNPIAYSSTGGYEGNGAIPSEYLDLGTLSNISFSQTPVQIAALTPASSIFNFLTD